MDDIKRIIYVDMDGVLADFDQGFYNICGLDADRTDDAKLWKIINQYGVVNFFAELPWNEGGKELWSFVNNNFLQVKILSSCGRQYKESARGKLIWLKSHLNSLALDDIILVENKRKKRNYSRPNDIIIDDTPVVISDWVNNGGIGILHKTYTDTIEKLKPYV